MTQNELIFAQLIIAAILIFFSFIALIVFFATKNNTKIALSVDYYMCLTCFVLTLYSMLTLALNPYDGYHENSVGGGGDFLVLSYKIYLSITVAALLLPYCLSSNDSLFNIKTQLRPKFKLIILILIITQIILIKRQRNIIDSMNYREQQNHLKEIGYDFGP